MRNYNFLSFFLIFLTLFTTSAFAEVYNEKGDFQVDVPSLKDQVLNDNIESTFTFTIKNNLNSIQGFVLDLPEKEGWDISVEKDSFSLNANGETTLNLKVSANEDFDYGTSVSSPDLLIISQANSYEGLTDFPIIISGNDEDISLKFILSVKTKDNRESYSAQFATQKVSPETPLGFSVTAKNLLETQDVEIILDFADNRYEFKDTFSKDNNYKVYQQDILSSIDPGDYDAKITIRLLKEDNVIWEFKDQTSIEVNEYDNLIIDESFKKSFFKNQYTVSVTNLGNTKQTYQKQFNISLFNSLFFNSNNNYEETISGVNFVEELNKGETKDIVFTLNYIPIYVILIVIVIFSIYVYVRKTSNPLDVETSIYEVKKVTHEGVKSMKVRIGFENIKEPQIDALSVIFRMPGYLSVKDNTFLLTEPNHVLKGKNQYKLVWDFKKFEENDARILGFALSNSRGILGDIKIPDLEIEVKVKGKIKRYYQSFPIIKG